MKSGFDWWTGCRLSRLRGLRNCEAFREHSVERAEKSKFILVHPFDPADVIHVIKQRLYAVRIIHFHLPQQRGVAVQREMRQRRYEEVLSEDEFFN